MNVVVGRDDAAAGVEARPLQLEHLDLDAVGQAALRVGVGVAPGKDARVASRLHVHPLDVQDEVLVHAVGAHHANRLPGADQDPVAHGPRVGSGVDVHPAGQVLAVEQVLELERGWRLREGRGGEEAEGKRERCSHGPMVTVERRREGRPRPRHLRSARRHRGAAPTPRRPASDPSSAVPPRRRRGARRCAAWRACGTGTQGRASPPASARARRGCAR